MFHYLLSMRYLFLLFAFVYFLPSGFSQPYYITTIAGNGTNVENGNGGMATSAGLQTGNPSVPDKYGNIYLATRWVNNTVRKIDASGRITHFAGDGTAVSAGDGGPASSASLNDPLWVLTDDSANVYIVENLGCRVRKVDYRTGRISTYAGNGGSTFSGEGRPASATSFGYITSMAFDSHGNVLLCANNGYINKIDKATSIVSNIAGNGRCVRNVSSSGPATADSGCYIYVCVDRHDNIYTSDLTLIRKIDSGTNFIHTLAGSLDTSFAYADSVPATNAHIEMYDINSDSFGRIYYSDVLRLRTRMVDTNGYVYTIGGNGIRGYSGDGGPAINAKIYDPLSTVVGACGEIYMNDAGNYRVRKIYKEYLPNISISLTNQASTTETGVVQFCSRYPTTLHAFYSRGGPSPAFRWYINGAPITTSLPYYTFTPNSGDSVRCEIVSDLYCVTNRVASSNSIQFIIDTLSPVSVSLSGIAGAAIGDTVHLNATITGAGSSYTLKWYNGDSLFATTTTPTVQYVKTRAIDSITVVLTSTARGCYDSTGSPIKTIVRYNTSVPVVTTAANEIWLQPNPAQTEIQIVAGNDWEQLVVTDVSGRVMYRESNQQHRSTQLNIASWPKGLYFVHTGTVAGKFLKD